MKRFLTLLIAAAMVLSFAACGDNGTCCYRSACGNNRTFYDGRTCGNGGACRK